MNYKEKQKFLQKNLGNAVFTSQLISVLIYLGILIAVLIQVI